MAKFEDTDDYVPVSQRFPDLFQDLDKSVKESDAGVGSETATFYALDIKDLNELIPKVTNPSEIKVLKVMHWNSLVSSEGIDDFVNVERLELSSNELTWFSATKLEDLAYLSLSWNYLQEAPNLKIFRELIFIDLSHNRIEDLSPFEELSRYQNRLSEVNLNDNLISNLDQIMNLSKFQSLTNIMFQDKKRKTDNPIWDDPDYKRIVWTYLPKLRILDGNSITIVGKENKSENIESSKLKASIFGKLSQYIYF